MIVDIFVTTVAIFAYTDVRYYFTNFNICKIKSTIYDLFQKILPIASIVKNISFLVFGFPFDARQQFKNLLIMALRGIDGRGHL